jgi:GH15 family glucan-1,4-alpha-glucosidase
MSWSTRDISGRYRIHKEVLTDPYRNVVLQKIRFEPLQGSSPTITSTHCSRPHLANFGSGNTGWIGDYKGYPMFFAERDGTALSLASRLRGKKLGGICRHLRRLAGSFRKHFQMEWEYTRAENGNIALPERSISPPATASSCWLWALVRSGPKQDSTRAPRSSRTTKKPASITSHSGGPGKPPAKAR